MLLCDFNRGLGFVQIRPRHHHFLDAGVAGARNDGREIVGVGLLPAVNAAEDGITEVDTDLVGARLEIECAADHGGSGKRLCEPTSMYLGRLGAAAVAVAVDGMTLLEDAILIRAEEMRALWRVRRWGILRIRIVKCGFRRA